MNPRLLAPARLARSVLRTQSDERLAELAAAGSDAAFEALVARHRRALVGHCARVVGPTDAEEAVQDALLRALNALRRGDEVRRVRPWLHVIAHHVAVNLHHARAARGECALTDAAESAAGDDGARAAARARLHEVVAALGDLPPRQREAIVMRELEGRSYAEIAERLGSSPGAVRQLLHRARAGVRDRVAGVLAWEPLVRWASTVAPGSRLGALSDACLVGAKVCAALVPAALGAGGLSALDQPRRATPSPAAAVTKARTATATATSASAARPARVQRAALTVASATAARRVSTPSAAASSSHPSSPASHSATRATVHFVSATPVLPASSRHRATGTPTKTRTPTTDRSTTHRSATHATSCPPATSASPPGASASPPAAAAAEPVVSDQRTQPDHRTVLAETGRHASSPSAPASPSA